MENNYFVKVVLDEGAIMPNSAHDPDAGYDLFCRDEEVIVPARGSAEFDTGVHMALVGRTGGMLYPKSGLNIKHDILSFGLIDVGFTGPIRVKLYNLGDKDYTVKRGDKITQIVFVRIDKPALLLCDELEATERGDGGFGSTGR